jgi:hypothetical protein
MKTRVWPIPLLSKEGGCATNKKGPFRRGADGVREPYEWIA